MRAFLPSILIEKFEQGYHLPTKQSDSHSILLFLMEQQEVKPMDLVDVLGSQEIVTELI